MEARSVLRRINPDLAKIDIACLKKILKCTFIKAMRKICCLSVHFLVFSKNFEKKKNKKINFFQKMEIKWQGDMSIQVDRKKEKTP